MDRLRIGVCIVVESHLGEEEIKKIRFQNFTVVTQTCRDS